MAGDYHMNDPRSQSRDQGVSYGSFGPWAGAVMQGMGMMPTGPLGALGLAGSLGLQGLTGKSLMGHAGGLLGFGSGMNPTAKSGLTPDEMMMGRGGGMSGGGLLDIFSGGGWSGGNMGINAGPMG